LSGIFTNKRSRGEIEIMPRMILKEGTLFILSFIGILIRDATISDIASKKAFRDTWVPNYSRLKVITK
jgi:hypothetical protein